MHESLTSVLPDQALHSMLEREVWKQLPMIPGGLPSIRGALAPPSGNRAFPFDTSNFGAWVSHGNPWRMQAYGARLFWHLLNSNQSMIYCM